MFSPNLYFVESTVAIHCFLAIGVDFISVGSKYNHGSYMYSHIYIRTYVPVNIMKRKLAEHMSFQGEFQGLQCHFNIH